jgi:hypothetical protein
MESFIASGYGNVESFGATGWNRFRPTRSGAELGVFLGEIREVPRMLKTTAKGFHDLWRSMGGSKTGFGPKSVANHWLNTQFGWLPFVSDLRNFYNVTKNLDRKLKQLRRDNGQWTRRGGTVSNSSDSSLVAEGSSLGVTPQVPTSLYAGAPYGTYRTTSYMTQNVWFRGAFRYYIPAKPDTWLWNAMAVAQLYGLQPSPSLIWELTPWSWLIDWCSNAGDCIDNLSSIMFDGLCAKYAYVMGTTSISAVHTADINYRTCPTTASWFSKWTRKSRVGASPFGFGLTDFDLSVRQWSILSALGLTRLR